MRKIYFSILSILFFAVSGFGQTPATFNSPGSDTWTAPCGVTSITVEAWGGGGAGGGSNTDNSKGGGGGAGGTYVSSVLTVTPGTTYNLSVGSGASGGRGNGGKGGSSWFNSTSVLLAPGGNGGAAPNGGTVAGGSGSTSGSIGTTQVAGIDGSNGTSSVGGAGGAGGNLGGAGGGQRTSENNGSSGSQPGGGGGGAYIPDNSNHDGGDGGNGRIVITYTGYCTPTFGGGVRPITNVTFAGINNNSSTSTSSPEYEPFCNVNGTVTQGSVYPISVSRSDNSLYYVRVYIDWNQNGVFGDASNELTIIRNSNGTGVNNATGNITVPATASLGNTTMRVVHYYNDISSPCDMGSNNYGQAEDYVLTVTSPVTIATGTIDNSPFCITPSIGAAVSVPFTSVGTFTSNTYTAQLSNASGSFASPVIIGTLVSDANSGTISATIPANTATGPGYRTRVISSNPSVAGTDNGTNFTINLAANSVTPNTTQNISAGVNGTILTATESTGAISREWFYGTTSGGPYNTSTGITATTYTPNFPVQGTYYVVCVSTFACGSVTSNQVQINVAATLTTGVISGSPFCVTPSVSATVSVPFTSVGTFTGNTYTAQLSNAAGSFASPATIGTLVSDANSGNINATISAGTATGTGYRIRVISNNPGVTGSSSAAFTINLSTNSVTPNTPQNINAGVNGGTLTATESTGATSREWFYGTTSGGPYNTSTGITTNTYTPNFPVQGTYYVVCVSTFACGSVTSNQVQINVAATVATGTISGSPFCITPSSGSPVLVPFTSVGTFTGNTYTAQLSNATGSFASPVTIGTLLSDANSGNINATIPAGTAIGAGYRIRVISSSPVVTGSDNSVNLTIVTPTINIGSALSNICEQGTSALLGATVGGSATGGAWSDGGVGGTFNPNATTLNATWTAPAGFTGTAVLTLTTSGGSCSTSASKNQIVNSRPAPTFIASPSGELCIGSPVTYSTQSGQSSYVWTFTGTSGIDYTISLGAGTSSVTLQWLTPGTKTVTVNYNNTNGCNALVAATTSNNVNTRPTATITSINTAICNPGTTNITGTVTAIGTWTVTLSDGKTATGNGNGTFSIAVSPLITTTYTLTSIVDANCTSFATDISGSTVVTVNEPVVITTQPLASQTSCATYPVSFTVEATGTGLTYQWYKGATQLSDNVNITGTGTKTLLIAAAGVGDAGTYHVVVSGAAPCGPVTSGNAVLNVNQGIIINTAPTSQVVCTGGTAVFTVSATGTGVNYQWRKGNVPIPEGGRYSGTNTAALTITGALAADAANNYNVLLTTLGGICPSAFTSDVSLIVNPVPVVNTVANKTICNGSPSGDFNFTGGVAGTLYNWTNDNTSIGLAASGAGNIASFSATNPGNSPVTATITVTPTYTNVGSPSTTCTGSAITFTITVNPTATVNAITGQELCNGSPTTAINFSSTSTGGTLVYNWTNNTPSIGLAATGSGNIASFNTINNGTAPVAATITVTPSFTNGISCGGTPIAFTIIVNPTPKLSSTLTPAAICNNTVFNYPPTSATSGITFNWSRGAVPGISNLAATGANNPNETLINTTPNPITVIYTYTLSANSCSNTQDVSVVVKPTPTLSGSLTPPDVCSNSLFSYNATSLSGGTTFSWSRTVVPGISNGAATGSGDINETLVNTSGVPVDVTYKYTLTANECSNVQNVILKVNPTVSIGPLAQEVCSGATISPISISGPTTGTIVSWSSSVPGITYNITNTGTSLTGTLTNSTTNAISVDFTITTQATNGGCFTTTTSTIIVDAPFTGPLVIGDGQILCGAAAPLGIKTAPTGGKVSSYFYRWEQSANGTTGWSLATNSTNSETYLPPQISNFYRLIITSCGSSITSNLIEISTKLDLNGSWDIEPNPMPTVLCSGDNFNYQITSGSVVGFFLDIDYLWESEDPGFFTAPGANPFGSRYNLFFFRGNKTFTVHNNTNAPITKRLLITPLIPGYCNLTTQIITITINPVPVIGNYTASACSGTSFSVSPTNGLPTSATIIPAGTKYSWSAPSVTGISGASSGNNQSVISGNLTNNTNAPIDVTYTVTPTFTSGITCTAISTFTVKVTVNPTPKIPAQTQTICNGGTFTVTPTDAPTATIVPPGTKYSWNAPSPITGISGLAGGSNQNNISGTLTNSTNAPIGVTYNVTPTAGCTGANFNVTVTVNPTSTAIISAAVGTVCYGTGTSITITGTPNTTVSYTVNGSPATPVLLDASGTVNISTGNLSANTTYALTGVAFPTAPTCSQSLSSSVTINVNPTATASISAGVSPICVGGSSLFNFTGTPNTVVTYNDGASNQTITLNGAGTATVNISPVTPNTTVTYTLVSVAYPGSPACSQSLTGNASIVVSPDANAGTISIAAGDPVLCIGETVDFDSDGDAGQWSSSDILVATVNSSTGVVTAVGAGTANIIYTVTSGCRNPKSVSISVTVNPNANAGILTGADNPNYCVGTNVRLFSTGDAGGTWTANNASVATVDNSGVVTSVGPGTVTITYTVTGGCNPPSIATKNLIFVNAGATAIPGPITGPSGVICSNTGGLNFSVDPVTDATFYVWTLPTGWIITSGANTRNITVTSTLTSGNITVVAGNACGFSPSPSVLPVGIHNYWTGTDITNPTDWNTAANWSDNQIPSLDCDNVYIPNTTNKPVLNSGTGTIRNLYIYPGAVLTVNGTGNLQIGGVITNNGTFDVTNGKLEFNGAAAQTISGVTFKDRTIKDLAISNSNGLSLSATAGDTLNITGFVTFGVSNAVFATNNNLTLKSTAAGTASVGQMSPNNDITGNVTVERYINVGIGGGYHGKSWQLLATPTRGQTVLQSWMEGGITASTGYGTQVIGPGGVAKGFDNYPTNLPSLKYYDNGTKNWVGIDNTGIPLYDKRGYLLFVRGDRSKSWPAVGNTTLRSKGTLFTAKAGNTPPSTTVLADQFESVGNPYASAIDMRNIGANDGASRIFTVWDPALAGAYGLGAYQAFAEGGDGNYYATPGGGSYGLVTTPNNFIQSGQAFFAQATGSNGTITFDESAKAGAGSYKNVLRGNGAAGSVSQLRANLYGVNADTSVFLTDGNLIQYNGNYSNKIDLMDARKISNSTENLGIRSGGKELIIERRHGIEETDTIFYNLSGVRVQKYQLEFIANALSNYGVQGYVEDTWLNTQTPLNMDGVTKVNFAVTNVTGSWAANRFRVVFRQAPAMALPVAFVSVKAYQKESDAAVEWKVENEKAMQSYHVERSTDGVRFTKLGELNAVNSGTQSYQWTDKHAAPGINYYRIRSLDQDGKVNYSTIVKVNMIFAVPSIGIYPNPITDGIVRLQLINQPEGMYGLRLLNSLGQVIVSKQVGHAGGNATENIKWDYKLAHGIYHLEITKPDGEVAVIKVMY